MPDRDDRYFLPQIMRLGGLPGSTRQTMAWPRHLPLTEQRRELAKGRPNKLFRQKRDGHVPECQRGSGMDFSGYCMGVAIGDCQKRRDASRPSSTSMAAEWRVFLNKGGGKLPT